MRRLLVCLMMIALPAALVLADAKGAMLQPHGNVLVNGGEFSKSGSIFAGDKVQTGADSAATITVEGSSVLLPARASVELGDNLLNVGCGGAAISTTKGMGVQAGRVTISPASDKATKFEVMQSAKWLQVVVREGKIFVRNGNQSEPLALAPGNSFTLKSAGSCALPPVAQADGGGLSNGAIAGIAVGAAAAGAVGGLAGTAFGRGHISPDFPH
ncbi:MAG: hypothetical protein ACRD3A_00825 [Terriglobales bacterium]